MSRLIVFVLICHITYTVSQRIPPQRQVIEKVANPQEEKKKDGQITINIEKPQSEIKNEAPPEPRNEAPLETKNEAPPESKHRSTTTLRPDNKNGTKKPEHKVFKTTEMESGALLRGVLVVGVLTGIVIVYLALKTYCNRKGKNPVMVNKYGVRTRRSDIEMTPLPLEDDDEDETLFEVHSTNR